MLIPPALRERALAARDELEIFSNLPTQLVLREFIDSGGYSAHLRRLREDYRQRREAMLALVRPHLGRQFEREINAAGHRLVLRCPPDVAARSAMRLREEGILCSTLSELSAAAVEDDGIVLGFAAFPPATIAGFGEAVARALRA